MKTDKELADELDAKDRLRRRGYTQKPCLSCNGKGYQWVSPIMC